MLNMRKENNEFSEISPGKIKLLAKNHNKTAFMIFSKNIQNEIVDKMAINEGLFRYEIATFFVNWKSQKEIRQNPLKLNSSFGFI